MYDCNDVLCEKVGDVNELYCVFFCLFVDKFIVICDGISDYLVGKNLDILNWVEGDDELIELLMFCY